MKEMTSVTEVMMADEDKEGEGAGVKGGKGNSAGGAAPAAEKTPGVPHPEQAPTASSTSADEKSPSQHQPQAASPPSKEAGTPRASTDAKPPNSTHLSTPLETPGSGTATPTRDALEKEFASASAASQKRKGKLTAEQKARIVEIGEEQYRAMDARIEELTKKLKDVSGNLLCSFSSFPFLWVGI